MIGNAVPLGVNKRLPSVLSCVVFALAPASAMGSRNAHGRGASPVAVGTISTNEIGGLPVSLDTSFSRALHHFGRIAPLSARAEYLPFGTCRLIYYRLGLELDFRQIGPAARKRGSPSICTSFFGATAFRTSWHTTNGLHVGGHVRTLKRLFPSAYDTGRTTAQWGVPVAAIEWDLTRTSGSQAQPVLVAFIHNGVVVALGVNIVGR
jgi:hypothetical protein